MLIYKKHYKRENVSYYFSLYLAKFSLFIIWCPNSYKMQLKQTTNSTFSMLYIMLPRILRQFIWLFRKRPKLLDALNYLDDQNIYGLTIYYSLLFLQIMKTFNNMIPIYTTCVRDGVLNKNTQVCDLVKGDIVYVEVGDVIPADIRIIDSKGFKVRIFIMKCN